MAHTFNQESWTEGVINPAIYSNEMCAAFIQGHCTLGDQCLFTHPSTISPLATYSATNEVLDWGANLPHQYLDANGSGMISSGAADDFEHMLRVETQDCYDDIPIASVPGLNSLEASRSKFSNFATSTLNEAFKLEPYPDARETQSIARQINLSPIQVRTWFANKRSRTKPPDIFSEMTAQERPPLTRRSLEDLNVDLSSNSVSVPYAASVGKSVGRSSAASSIASGKSARSSLSIHSTASRVSRQGRRVWPYHPRPQSRMDFALEQEVKPRLSSRQTFHCKLCQKAFTTKYAWRRHESSVHALDEKWICWLPESFEVLSTGNELWDQHLSGLRDELRPLYDVGACETKSLEERTFYRADHLRQHLYQVHSIDLKGERAEWAEGWRNKYPLPCCICGAKSFGTADEGLRHLETHALQHIYHKDEKKEEKVKGKDEEEECTDEVFSDIWETADEREVRLEMVHRLKERLQYLRRTGIESYTNMPSREDKDDVNNKTSKRKEG